MRDVTLHEMLPPEPAAAVHERWRPLAEHGHIIYMRGQVYVAAERVPVGARIMLPLCDGDHGRPTGLIGLTDCDWVAARDFKCEPHLDITYIPLAEIDGAATDLAGAA